MHRLLVCFAAIVFGIGLQAAEVDVGHCIEIANDAERLACYDQTARASVATKPDADFGMNPELRRALEPEGPDAITAKVTALKRDPRGYFILTLDNDQTWSLTELSSALHFRVGDEVRIVKGALGSHRLSKASGGVAARAKRTS